MQPDQKPSEGKVSNGQEKNETGLHPNHPKTYSHQEVNQQEFQKLFEEGIQCQNQKNYEKAKQKYKKAEQLNKSKSQLYKKLVVVQKMLNNYQQARDWANRLKELQKYHTTRTQDMIPPKKKGRRPQGQQYNPYQDQDLLPNLNNQAQKQLPNSKKIQNPNKYPYSAVGVVVSYFERNNTISQSSFGTGCLIGNNIVLTSSCNIIDIYGQYPTRLSYIPAPEFPNKIEYYAKRVYSPKSYQFFRKHFIPCFENKYPEYAVIQLNTKLNLEQMYGSLSYDFDWQANRQLNQSSIIKNIKVIGFSSIRRSIQDLEFIQLSGQAQLDKNNLKYKLPTNKRFSGAPVIEPQKGQFNIRAIHNQNLSITGIPGLKYGVILDKKIREDVEHKFSQTLNTLNLNVDFKKQNTEQTANQFKKLLDEIKDKYPGKINTVLTIAQGGYPMSIKDSQYFLEELPNNILQLQLQKPTKIQNSPCKQLVTVISTYLQVLNLSNIQNEGIINLASIKLYKLKQLYLSHNNIDDQGLKDIDNGNWRNLKILFLDNNKISCRGCQYLCSAKWKQLEFLNLSSNQIKDQGCGYLTTYSNTLTRLYLNSNLIGDQGCQYLVAQFQWEKLELISLRSNKFGENWKKWLEQRFHKKALL